MERASASKGEAERPPEPTREAPPGEAPTVEVRRGRCPYCHDAIAAEDAKQGCSDCMGWSHAACWSEHGGCAACGARAEGAPPAQARPRGRPPRQIAPPGRARWRGERQLKDLDPSLALPALREAFAQHGALLTSSSWGFGFRNTVSVGVRGRLWLEEHDEGVVLRWEAGHSPIERALLVLILILGLPTIVISLFCLWCLRHLPRVWVERRVRDALRAARARQQE
ncbi:MAG: hypothetical protein R3F62_27750 [Planctomycetota bacterium]